MTQDTKNKFAELLNAAQNKTANLKANDTGFKPTVKDIFPNVTPEIKKEETKPDLSDTTFADLIPESKPKIQSLTLVDYSDKSFAVIGETKPIKDQLRQLGGKFNYYLSCGAGWIFPKTKAYTVRRALNLIP